MCLHDCLSLSMLVSVEDIRLNVLCTVALCLITAYRRIYCENPNIKTCLIVKDASIRLQVLIFKGIAWQ